MIASILIGSSSLQLVKHLDQQFHGQANHIRLATLNHVNPAKSVLVSERSGLVLPLPTVEILVQLWVAEGVHTQTCLGDPHQPNVIWPAPQAKAAVDMMRPTA